MPFQSGWFCGPGWNSPEISVQIMVVVDEQFNVTSKYPLFSIMTSWIIIIDSIYPDYSHPSWRTTGLTIRINRHQPWLILVVSDGEPLTINHHNHNHQQLYHYNHHNNHPKIIMTTRTIFSSPRLRRSYSDALSWVVAGEKRLLRTARCLQVTGRIVIIG